MNNRKPPRLPEVLLRLRFSRATCQFLLGDLQEEFHARGKSKTWYWAQVWTTLALLPVRSANEPERKMDMGFLSGFWNDLRYAARSLAKSPGLAATAILAIALGVSVNTTVFTLLNAVALRPLPVPAASSVVRIYQSFQGKHSRNVNGSPSYFSYSEYANYRDHNQVFGGLAAYYPFFGATLAGEHPRRLFGALASCNYFDVMAVRPALGRSFRSDECAAPGEAAVVVISDELWRGTFGGDKGILGKSVTLNRVPLTVIGVAAPGFLGAEAFASDFWVPLTMDPAIHPGNSLKNDNLSWLVLLGRLKAGVPLARARADLGVIAERLDRLYPGRKTRLTVDVAHFADEPEMRQGVLSVSAVVFAAVSLVLLIACANVANLLLARATARKKEIAVRLSVGASRARLIRQLLTESVLLALPAGAAGALIASLSAGALLRAAASHLPQEMPGVAFTGQPDFRVLIYTLALTILTGIVFGLAPALQASRPDLTTALKEEGAGAGTHGSRGFLRSTLVAAQVSVCLVLLITAGLLARGLLAAQSVEPGFQTRNVIVADFDLELEGYDNARAAAFHRSVEERVARLPGVDGAARAVITPLGMNTWGTGIKLPGQAEFTSIHYNEVMPEYFSLFGIPLIRGRNFTEADSESNVAIVMEATARKLWPRQDPLGKIFQMEDGPNSLKQFEVVGVAHDSHTSSLSQLDPYFFYFPLSGKDQLAAKLIVHTSAPLAGTEKQIQMAARGVDPNVLVRTASMDQNIDLYRMPGRLATALAGVLGGFALLLASIGIYGVVSYAVSRRVREIGIRMTLGAGRREVLRLVMRGAMTPVAVGALLGIAACAGVSRVLSTVLYGVSPLDPVAFAGVTLFLLGIALLASYMPARRATRVDPMVALRYE